MDRHFKFLRPARGFSLIEMALVLALTATMLIVFYMFVSSQMISAVEESSEITVQSDIRATMSALVQELEGSRLTGLDSNATWVSYQTPVVGPSGSFILDVNGNVQYGANPYDNSGFITNGYYTLSFVDDNLTFVENQMTSPDYPSGQNISGSITVATNGAVTVPYDKAFIFGHFQVQVYNASGTAVGTPRVISGKALRQYWPSDPNKLTYPWGGGFFYMRNTLAKPTLNAAGTGAGTVWSPQSADVLADINGDGQLDPGDTYVDVNLNGVYDPPDCDPFNDTNGNNVKDPTESVATPGASASTPWNGSLRIQVRSFDPENSLKVAPYRRDAYATVRLLTTKVKIRNN